MMNYLKKFESFQTQDEIHKICKQYKITNYTINSDGSIDVDGDVKLGREYLTRLPLKFNKVSGIFNCASNNLTTLEGSPKSVDEHFICAFNKLITLEYAPQSANDFDCSLNKLITLEGAPLNVLGHFDCSKCDLTTLEGGPQFVTGNFNCSDNNLTTLEGAPQSVKGYFSCYDNNLTTLEGAPQSVDSFDCFANEDLKSLYYLSEYIDSGQVEFEETTVYEIFKLFNDFSLSKIRYINDFKVIEDDKINLEMLNALLYDHGKLPVENVKGYINI